MIIPDINLLLYAQMAAFPEHDAARTWWEAAMNGEMTVGLAMPAVFGFLRLGTNPRVFTSPLSVNDATQRVEEWFTRPQVQALVPGPKHLEIAFGLLRSLGTTRNLTTDVQLAALAIEHQAELHSNDADFGRFPGLRWKNPIPPIGRE